jgi:hypothetical protein
MLANRADESQAISHLSLSDIFTVSAERAPKSMISLVGTVHA